MVSAHRVSRAGERNIRSNAVVCRPAVVNTQCISQRDADEDEALWDYAEEGIVLTISIDADLSAPPDKDKRSIGASLLLRRTLGTWLAKPRSGGAAPRSDGIR